MYFEDCNCQVGFTKALRPNKEVLNTQDGAMVMMEMSRGILYKPKFQNAVGSKVCLCEDLQRCEEPIEALVECNELPQQCKELVQDREFYKVGQLAC